MSEEIPLVIPCQRESMVGILHRPDHPHPTGVVVIVGGPQYRVGSHRQFILLARHLAAQGIAVLRFDCRGMGDSSGEFPGFERMADDIEAAVGSLCAQVSAVQRVALWGLCDAASAAAMYANSDRRIAGMVLLNPWVRSDATLARAYLRHYYLTRLLSRDFWSKLLSGGLKPARVAGDLAGNIRAGTALGPGSHRSDFVSRMRDGLGAFAGPVLIVLSENDITAAEFADVTDSPEWQRVLRRPNVTSHRVAGADHTFSTAKWRDEVAELTARWLYSLESCKRTGHS